MEQDSNILLRKNYRKINEDISSLVNTGKIINKPKSSYGLYKLSNPRYPDEIENIIYNKKIMMENIKKKKKKLSKLIEKKDKILKKLETKKFSKHVLNELSSKFRIINGEKIIQGTLNEELESYRKDYTLLMKKRH